MPELCRILEFPIFIIGAILSAIMGAAWVLGELDFGLFTNAAFERLFATPSFLALFVLGLLLCGAVRLFRA